MTFNILLIGSSGYIGGSTLSALVEKHPSWHITVIVRNENQASTIQNAFPAAAISTIIGSLDIAEVLATEAAKASITLQLANGDHDAGTDALLAAIGSVARPESSKYYIHLSGAATVLDLALAPGLPPSRSWNDTSDLPEILNLPATQIHAATEQRIISFASQHAENGVRTAIVSPPAVAGVGTGPIKRGSAYHINMILQRRKAFVVGEGRNRFATAHVKDVADGIVALVEAAYGELEAESDSGISSGAVSPRADWSSNGYYFLTSDWTTPDKATYVEKVVSLLGERSVLLEDGVDHLTAEESASLHPYGPIIFGASLEVQGRRIQERLGFK
ncbi:NAD-dependent epimerase/dehydratase family protein, partial [Aspergillus glaucus CBS 516.65]